MTDQAPMHLQFSVLSDYGIIRVSGADAAGFLQGQFGNDLNLVDETHHQLNCYSNPKGRLLAVFRVFFYNDDYYLRMPREIVPATISRLKMFVLMAKVTLEDVSDSLACIGLSGPEASDTITELTGGAPDQIDDTYPGNEVTVLRVPGKISRYEIYGEGKHVDAIQKSLETSASQRSDEQWAYDDLIAGIPTIREATREEFVAQMVNLQLIDGLSFKKGCYPGQEIVARMHYLGKLKRRMYLTRLTEGELPAPGTEIFTSDGTSSVGKVVDARRTDEQPPRALVVLAIASAESADLHIGSANGPFLTIESLPYAFDSADSKES